MTANNAMLTKETRSQIAHRLHQAEQSREQIRQISLDHPQITIEDAIKADQTFSILMGDKVEPRKNFIEKNAQYATLDV